MAKTPQDDSKEIKNMLQQLFKAIKIMSSTSIEQQRINRELMKVMSLLNSGFVESADDANKLINTIKENGFSLTDEFIKKWAKARKATDEDLESIVKRFHEIDELSDDVIDSAKDYTELLEDQIGSIEDQVDLSTKLLRGQNKITEAVTASKKQAMALAGTVGDINGITEKLVKNKVDLTGMFDGMFKGVENGTTLLNNMKSDMDSLIQRAGDSELKVNLMFNPLTDDLDKEVKKALSSIEEERNSRLQGLRDYYAKNTEIQDKIAKSIAAQDFSKDMKFDVDTSDITVSGKLLKQGTSEYQSALDSLTKIVSDNDLGKKVSSDLEDMVKLMAEGGNLSEKINQKALVYYNMLGDSNKLMAEEFDSRLSDLKVLEASIIKERGRLAIIGDYTTKLTAAKGVVEKIGAGFDYIDSILPKGVSDFLGISSVSLSLLDAHTKGVEKFSAHVKDGGDLTKSMGVYMAELGPSIRTALSPMLLLVAAGAMLFQTLRTAVQTYKDMASSMKISIKQAKDLHNVGLDTLTSQKNQFSTMEDIQAIQAEMIESGRSIYMLNTKGAKELSISLTEVGKAFGYGTQQAAQLQNVFTQLGASDDLALNLQTNLGFMTEMAGLSPQIISQDLIDGADEVATYFAGMPAQAAQAALGIRKMGMSLKQAGQIAQKMLDLEGFMTDMYELQAMTSGGMDLSGAFDKGLMGDIEGMTKDIMNEIGTTAEYNKMDYLTRTKIAKTLGMSADELGKSVKLNEQISQFSGMEKEALEANKDRLGDISKLNKEQVSDRLKQLQSTDRLGVAWDKIKGVLLKALIPLAESFADAIDAISPIIDIIVMALKGVGLLIKIILPIVKGMLAPFKFIGDILSKVTSYLDESASSASGLGIVVKGIGSTFDKIGEYAYYIGAAIGTWALLFKMPAVIGGVVGMFKTILSFIPGVGTILSSLTGGLGGIFGGMGKKAETAAKESTDPVVNMTTKISDSMVGMVDSIKSSMDDMVTHIKSSVASAGDALSKGLNKSPTQKMMEDIKKEGSATSKELSSQAEKSAGDMKAAITDGAKVSKKKLEEVKQAGIGLIPKSAIKDSFGLLVEIGTKSLAALAAKSITSFMFATKEGEQKMSGMGAEVQGMIQMAAMGGSTFLIDILQDSVSKVFSKRFEKKLEGGVGSIGEMVTKKLSGGFESATGEGKGMFSKIGSAGKSVFEKMSTFAKSLFSKAGKDVTGNLEEVAEKINPVKSVTENVTQEVVGKKVSDKLTKPKIPTIELPTPPTKQVEKTGSIFKGLADVIKGAWSAIKSTILDIVKFIGDALKSITGAIGKSIENLLKGIGNGLSSFKTSAVKGAAALVLVSGALWITSKALENFSNVSWESVGKGIVTLGGLTIAAIALGKVSGQVIKGALAIALLGASLIPAAFALNMFNDVKWETLGKAGVALIGLGVAGGILGGMLPMMLMGAIGIAAMGASLIPAALALNMFNDVDWGSLAKAGVALVGLGVAGGILGGMMPLMLMGAIGIAAIGAAMIPMAIAMKMFNDVEWESLGKAGAALVGFGLVAAGFGLVAPLILAGALTIGVASISLFAFAGSVLAINLSMKGLDIKPMKELTSSLIDLTGVSILSLFGVAGGIMAISTSMAALSMAGLGSSVAKLFGGDAIKDLERLAILSEPLNAVNQVISQLAASIMELSDVLGKADFDSIQKLNDIDVKSIDHDVNQKINTVNGKVKNYDEPSVGYKIAPQQPQTADAMPPKKESVAQNVKINSLPGKKSKSDEESGESSNTNNSSVQNSYYGDSGSESGVYNRPGMDTKKLEMLLMRLIQLNEMALQKSTVVQMNGQKVGTILKKENNK